jgi:excisionase family DNA binding protein
VTTPVIGARSSGVLGGHAVISGDVAGLIVRLCGDWRRDAVRLGCPPPTLAQVEQAIVALHEAAGAAFPRETWKGQGKPEAPRSATWLTSQEAAGLLGVSRQRVGQLAAEGRLQSHREGGQLRFGIQQVLALRAQRESQKAREFTEEVSGR